MTEISKEPILDHIYWSYLSSNPETQFDDCFFQTKKGKMSLIT